MFIQTKMNRGKMYMIEYYFPSHGREVVHETCEDLEEVEQMIKLLVSKNGCVINREDITLYKKIKKIPFKF